ncbi:hypothetical protein ACFY1L_38165 [Streptomyces sp. NPDC001663]|uniref:hypothetical protein n=1 Tax=Streptomyces sp. NPDC001663 TaxID=3364597 RepID=UPI00367EFDE2
MKPADRRLLAEELDAESLDRFVDRRHRSRRGCGVAALTSVGPTPAASIRPV